MSARSPRRAAALFAIGALAATVLAGCGVTHPSPSATALPSGITAELVPLTSKIELRQVQVEIHNTSEDPLEIGLVRIEDPRFAGRAGRTVIRPKTIAPGESGIVRLQLPAIDCTVPNEGTPTASVGFTLGASSSTAVMALPDVQDVIAGVYTAECGTLAGGAASAAQ
ncbi:MULTISPECIES: hypothetical protein [unclassified Microbacterium]|uniref:hypothetical protein n=1 Tax=unclassified Microbacterium TaxID=2609290 RepID=UPI003746F223